MIERIGAQFIAHSAVRKARKGPDIIGKRRNLGRTQHRLYRAH